jgi:hypothetical protein
MAKNAFGIYYTCPNEVHISNLYLQGYTCWLGLVRKVVGKVFVIYILYPRTLYRVPVYRK